MWFENFYFWVENSNTKNKWLRFNFISYFVFLIWPFLGLIYAALNFKLRQSKNIIWLFCGFFGYTFVISKETFDSAHYRDTLLRFNELNHSIVDFIALLMAGQYNRGDYIQPLLTYIVSRFTDDYRILFLIFGLIFGYFLSRNIEILLDFCTPKLKILAIPVLLLFIFLVPIWNINGVRFYVATQIFIYGVLMFYMKNKRKGLIISISSLLMHFSFVIPSLLLGLHLLLPKKMIIYISLLILSSLFISIDVENLIKLIPNIDGKLDSHLNAYTHIEYVENRLKEQQNTAWFLKWNERGLQYLMILFVGIMLYYYQIVKKLKFESPLLFGILVFSFANIVSVIPSMGRFHTISHLIITALFFIFLQNIQISAKIRLISPLYSISILFFIVISIRFGLEMMGYYVFLLNPFIAPFFEMSHSFK